MPITDPGIRIDVLDERECHHLLAGAGFGRLAFTEGALPAIALVHFAVHEGQVLVAARVGSTVATGSRNAVVAFEADSYDVPSRTGWSVTVVGNARVVTDPGEVLALDAVGLPSWAPAPAHCYIAVQIRILRGRRVRTAATAADPDA